MGTRDNAALFGLLFCLPTAPTLPLNSQDIGTSGWQLVDKATLLARVGEGGAPMSLFCRATRAEQCRLAGADRPTYAHCEVFAFWTHNGHWPAYDVAVAKPAINALGCYPADRLHCALPADQSLDATFRRALAARDPSTTASGYRRQGWRANRSVDTAAKRVVQPWPPRQPCASRGDDESMATARRKQCP